MRGHGDAKPVGGIGTSLACVFLLAAAALAIAEAAHPCTVLGAQGVDSGVTRPRVLNACCTEGRMRAAREAGVPTVVCWRTETCDPGAASRTTLFEANSPSRAALADVPRGV